MSDIKFDKMINMQLVGYHSPINVDELWAAIEPNINSVAERSINNGLPDPNSTNSSKKALWIVLALLAALSAYYIYSNVINSENSNNNVNFTPVIEKNDDLKIINKKENQIEIIQNVDDVKQIDDSKSIKDKAGSSNNTRYKKDQQLKDKNQTLIKKKDITRKKLKKVGEIVPGSDPL